MMRMLLLGVMDHLRRGIYPEIVVDLWGETRDQSTIPTPDIEETRVFFRDNILHDSIDLWPVKIFS